MKIYHLKMGTHGYDQFSEFIVVAASPEKCLEWLRETHPPAPERHYAAIDYSGGVDVVEINPGEYTQTTPILEVYVDG